MESLWSLIFSSGSTVLSSVICVKCTTARRDHVEYRLVGAANAISVVYCNCFSTVCDLDIYGQSEQ